MQNKYFTLLISLSTLTIGFLLGYILSVDIAGSMPDQEVLAAVSEEATSEPPAPTDEPVSVYNASRVVNSAKINSGTTIVYLYHYLKDGVTEMVEEQPPLFMIDKTEEDVRESLDGWEIVSFTEDKVVLRKELDEKSGQHYIIGIFEGYVAVFLDRNGTSVVKEITGKPASALSENEIAKLEQGIKVFGDDALFKILEDYGS